MTYFRTVVADPPWTFRLYSERGENRSPQSHYGCMTLNDIKALPVAEVADPGGCVLFLWATNPMLPHALDVMDAWSFVYVTKLEWVKMTKDGLRPAMGTGYRLRGCTESLLIGVSGKRPYSPPMGQAKRGVLMTPRLRHSQKPDESFAYFEQCDGPYLELFARQPRPGWTCLGNEIDGRDIRESVADLVPQGSLLDVRKARGGGRHVKCCVEMA